MADWDSADCLARLKLALQRPTTDDATTDAQLYQLLSNGQLKLIQVLAAHVPWINYDAPELLTTADSGYTYTFASYPLGHAELREARNGIVMYPVPEWSDNTFGYVMEGQTIRFPRNQARTFSAGPYARYVKTPASISASVQPVVRPTHARQALVLEAAAEWALLGGLRDPSPYLLGVQRFLWGDGNTPGHVGLIPSLKNQYRGQGSQAIYDGRWWLSADLTR